MSKPTIEVCLDELSGSQYYRGHGHSFASEDLVTCLFFAVPVCRVETKQELRALIMGEIRAGEFQRVGIGAYPDVSDEEISEQITDADLEFYLEAFNECMRDWESEDLIGFDYYLYGWVHIYAPEKPTLCPICGEHITITGKTTDGRLIGSCRDAFTLEQWNTP